MPVTYIWKNSKTDEVIETESRETPPDQTGDWKRVYSFGLGSVMGAGQSPGRTSSGKRTT